jgi:ribosomal protein S18 acetylase RimI-like enzyme
MSTDGQPASHENIEIRKATENDRKAVWNIVKAVIQGGDTYVFSPGTPQEEMMDYWFSPDKYNYVAVSDGNVVGTFWLKANQPGLGSHVANAAYAVSPDASGQGIGRLMADFSINEARKLGFKAMQFNFVVKSNDVAVRLWQKVGFEIIGEIPDAFDHVHDGMTNAYIMYRKL